MADMGKTETAATAEERISAEIQMQLIEVSKLVPTVQDFSSMATKGVDVIKVPRAGDFTVDDKAENVAVTAQVITYATDNMNLDKYKVIQVLLEDDAELDSKPDIVADIIGRMARGIALQVDTDIVAALAATSAAAPDHRIAYANASTLGKADILEARRLLHEQNVPFNECYIGVSPASEKALLAIDDFVHADKYGSAEGLRNGELGRLYGAPVIMSNEFGDNATLVWHPTHVGFAMHKMASFETDRQLEKLATLYSVSQKYGTLTMDSGKRGVLLGSAS
jgi:N4-gp56 family major capsid protein